jgi:hypothetical protein
VKVSEALLIFLPVPVRRGNCHKNKIYIGADQDKFCLVISSVLFTVKFCVGAERLTGTEVNSEVHRPFFSSFSERELVAMFLTFNHYPACTSRILQVY